MFTLYLTETPSILKADSKNFQIFKQQKIFRKIPIESVKQIILFPGVHVSRQSENAVKHYRIPILFIAEQGQILVHCDRGKPLSGKHIDRQKQCQQDQAFSRAFARTLLRAKIHNRQTILLQSLTSNTYCLAIRQALDKLTLLKGDLPSAKTVQTLWRIEKQASYFYRRAFPFLLPDSFQIQPSPTLPRNSSVNTLLNLGYAFLSQSLYHLITRSGLDPEIGHFHTSCSNHTPLVCDLMEQFRPQLVEELIVESLHFRQLTREDFIENDTRDHGLLSPLGIAKFIDCWESKLQTIVCHWLAGNMTYHQALEWQVQQYISHLQGASDSYLPLLMKW
jgi:CRISPR-associated protein Cas1